MINIDLSPEIEAHASREARARGLGIKSYLERIIKEALMAIPSPKPPRLTPEHMAAFFEQMSADSEKIVQLPDEAFERSSFYRDHD